MGAEEILPRWICIHLSSPLLLLLLSRVLLVLLVVLDSLVLLVPRCVPCWESGGLRNSPFPFPMHRTP